MLILAFDTSSKTAAVSVLRDQTVLYDTIINKGLNHSEVLLPGLDEALRVLNIRMAEIDLFACTLGPGSFTGLRIGVSTLKGLMLATGKPAAGVSSLSALALNADRTESIVCSMMDAGRGQVYLAYYRYDENGFLGQLEGARAIDPHDIVDHPGDEVIYVGDGAIKYADIIRSRTKHKSKIASPAKQYICGSAVGRLAIEKFRSGDLLDAVSCAPVYLRSADALAKKKTVL
ncbi:MAG: tRNA (adenosine(37)-N6)-threonylcarbamoyltransferase complex dimerization subunit type 1 TsaB [Deltaproteobacteria bacterium]|nr:tRNA (adenosine(37)-N6)-threonylcarbamoyltransferase complex dimerization subunit type 1 TsaB [Deltaproteobacteria bacterium]